MSFDGLKEEEYVGGKIFSNIQVDDRVTKNLQNCLYCKVISRSQDGITTTLQYEIPLNCINGADFKQCPVCKRIYILMDPIK